MANLITTIYILLSLCSVVKHVAGTSNGLTLELFIQDTLKPSNKVQQNIARPELDVQDKYHYMVKVGIGTTAQMTKPFREYMLHVDTGSPLSWLQCEGCMNSFNQQPRHFPQKKSKSFHRILSSDKLCLTNQRDGKYCTYKIDYANESSSAGIVAKESLFLCTPNTESCTKFDDLVFGCGMDQRQMVYAENARNKIAGVLGLGRGPLSFVSQIESISDGKFSHCFPPDEEWREHPEKRKTYLRFGADAASPKPNQMNTKLHVIGRSPFYYVELDGISYNGQRLIKIREKVFRVKYSEGGVYINSGVKFTQLVMPAYDALVAKLDSHFIRKLKYKEKTWQNRHCYYKKKAKPHRVPTVTFHFKRSSSSSSSSADLVLKPDALFTNLYGDTICLGIHTHYNDNTTIIGAHQLVNHWVTFDTKNNMLSFHQEDCKMNG